MVSNPPGVLAAVLLAAWAMLAGPARAADDLADIVNYRAYSDTLASAGQPTREQLKRLRDAGFERVVFLAFTDHQESIPDEDRLVTDLGLQYVQIPVVWERPRPGDFAAFAAVLQSDPGKKTLVHCQVNYRASAFSFLYRVLYEGVPMDAAKDDMNRVWVPNATWREFLFTVLEANGRSPHCEQCLWEED